MTMLVDNNAARVNAYIASAVPEESLVEHDSLLASLRMPENVVQAFQNAQLNYESTGPTSGLDPYTYTNVQEFRGEISEYFLSGSSGARVIQEMSPKLYGVMSRFYVLTYPGN